VGTKDIRAKEYLSDNERFADLCNVVLFSGEQVIHAGDLEEKDPNEVLSVLGVNEKEVLYQQKWRDLLKHAVLRLAKGVYVMLIGIENQSDIHYAMPVKNMVYDALNYGEQVKEAANRHKENKEYKTSAEFLSGFQKTDRLTPIITITVYWGVDEWDAPRSLHEMFGDLDESWKSLIPNYSIILAAANEIDDFAKFQTNLGYVFEVIRYSRDDRKLEKFITTKEIFSHMDNDSVMAINTFTGLDIPIIGNCETSSQS
jgi:hypothetical protein